MKALILAAGYATRLYPLTKNMPKALLPIAGKAILDYLTEQLATIPGLRDVHIASNHRFAEQFSAWAEGAKNRYPGLRFTVWDDGTTDDTNKLGAVGDMRFVIERAGLDDDTLIAASDNFFTFPLLDYYDDFRRHGRDTLLAQRIDDIETLRRFAVATLDQDNRVLDMVEKPQNPPSDVGVYALYLYRRDTLPLIKQYLEEGNPADAPGHFPVWLVKRRDVRAYLFQGECVDVGTPESYRETCARFASAQ